jgi:DNA gyrase subunit A
VVTRRTIFDLRRARERAHVLEGLAIALGNIDPVIALIKASPNPAAARDALMARTWAPGLVVDMLAHTDPARSRPEDLAPQYGLQADGYHLSERQAKAILDLQLQRLTGLEQDKIVEEFRGLLANIDELMNVLTRPDRLMQVIRDELTELRDKFGDKRRTEIVADEQQLDIEDLIAEEDVVVTLSHAGYAKSQPVDTYRSQRRGGKGRTATTTRDEDFVDKLFVASTHDTILCFSSRGKLYWMKVYELPQAGPTARGKPLVNLLPLVEGERITAVLPIRTYDPGQFVFMATRRGTVKKTPLEDFSRPRPSGIIAVELLDDDSLVGVALTSGNRDVMLVSSAGKAVRFKESDVRAMGRQARGVRGIRLTGQAEVIALILVEPGENLLTATQHGYGKRTSFDEFAVKGRGGQGVIAIQTSARNGSVIGARSVAADDEIMLISDGGTLVRTPVSGVSIQGRNTQGVRLITLAEGEKLVGMDKVAEYGNGDGAGDE